MSMEVIYVDSLLLINLIINYFLLLLTGKVCGLPLLRLRFALGAALGAVYSLLVVLPGLEWLQSAPIKAAAGLFMALIAFGGERRFLRSALAFFVVSAAFGGAVYAASMLGGLPRGDSIYIPVSMRVLVLSFALCYVVISIVFHRAVKKAERRIHDVELAFMGRISGFSALRDTGNELYDYASGCEVMVVDSAAVEGLFTPAVSACLNGGGAPTDVFEALSAIPGCAGRFRLLPYSAVGVSQGLLLGFRPDKMLFDGREEKNILIGLSPNRLSEDNEFQAVI